MADKPQYAIIDKESNVEYVTKKVAGMVRNAEGGASAYTEVLNPIAGAELVAILCDVVLQDNNLSARRAIQGGGTGRACVLITLEGSERPEGDAAGLPA